MFLTHGLLLETVLGDTITSLVGSGEYSLVPILCDFYLFQDILYYQPCHLTGSYTLQY